MTHHRLRVEKVHDSERFQALREAWDQLLALCPEPSVFLTCEWLWPWWKSFGRNDRHGLRSYSVSGRVKNTGMKQLPIPGGLKMPKLFK